MATPAASASAAAAAAAVVAIAVVQFAPGADLDDNLERMSRLAREAAAHGAQLVVFPEYSSFFTPTQDAGTAASWVAHAQPLDGPFVGSLAGLARELGIHLVAGIVERVVGETARVANTLVALDPQGELVARYRKLHLYDAFGQRESEWIVPGAIEPPQTFSVAGLTAGLQTCYDLRFPEVTRRLVDAGADLVLVPSEWVRGPLKETHWRTLLTARAIENTVYLAAADHTPPVGVGTSMILDPMGVELAGLGETEGVALAWITPDRVAEVRRINPALELRRFRVSPY